MNSAWDICEADIVPHMPEFRAWRPFIWMALKALLTSKGIMLVICGVSSPENPMLSKI